MPRRTVIRTVVVRRKLGRRRRMRGRGFASFLGKANSFLKNSKLISGVGGALGAMGVPYASQIGSVAGSLGYGRRGGGLRLAGAGYRRRR